MTGAVRMALEAAAMANLPNARVAGDRPSSTELRMTANSIAAFLRALPDYTLLGGLLEPSAQFTIGAGGLHRLAAAVEAAAKEGV